MPSLCGHTKDGIADMNFFAPLSKGGRLPVLTCRFGPVGLFCHRISAQSLQRNPGTVSTRERLEIPFIEATLQRQRL